MNGARRLASPGIRPRTNGAEPAEPGGSGAARGLKILGSVLGPTTFLTALLFYFGNQHAFWYFDYFGVNATIMGLTTQDYLVRSVDPLFTPLTIAAALCLGGLWTYRALRDRLSDRAWRRLVRTLAPTTAAIGAALLGVAAFGFVDPVPLRRYLGLPGVALAAGVLLLVAASRLRRTAGSSTKRDPLAIAATEWTAVFVLVAIGLFWAVTDYAKAVGTGRGEQQQAQLRNLPDVTVYSANDLNLTGPTVGKTVCANTAYNYRYDGLKLVLQSGGQYFFLPVDWTPAGGTAFVIPRTDALRLEFAAPGSQHPAGC